MENSITQIYPVKGPQTEPHHMNNVQYEEQEKMADVAVHVPSQYNVHMQNFVSLQIFAGIATENQTYKYNS